MVLQNPTMNVSRADKFEGIELNHEINITTSSIIPQGTNSYLGLYEIDLTGINFIAFQGSAVSGVKNSSAGIIEVRIDSPTGKLVGQTPDIILDGRGGEIPLGRAAIVNAGGIHDVYFVFTTGKAGGTPNQMQIRNIKFGQ